MSSSRLLYLASILCFAVLAFLPQSKAASWLDLLLAPTRVLGELASPIGMFARREARAAERELAGATEQVQADSRLLAVDERMFALPDEERLISGRRFVHAQVVRRLKDAPDRVECTLEDKVGPELVIGLPAVLSNSYVGRVAQVDLERGRITVNLVTGKEFRVGASCEGASPDLPTLPMVVGGLEPTHSSRTPLSLHNPATEDELRGVVRVDESLNPHETFGELSGGFRLGQLERTESEHLAVLPDIDFANGLFRVVVVLPLAAAQISPRKDFEVFAAENWREVRAYSACEPALWREGVKIDFPAGEGARASAAVVAGARLVGFVARAGALDSDVSLLGDRGVSVPAQACVDGEVAPLVLGHLISLGREAPGAPARFLWTCAPARALAAGPDGLPTRHARLYTGAGELGVPRGLFIGDCRLPCGEGRHVIEVESGVDARLLRKLLVWRGIEREEREARP